MSTRKLNCVEPRDVEMYVQSSKLKFDNMKANVHNTQPTFLLLTQNVGALYAECWTKESEGEFEEMKPERKGCVNEQQGKSEKQILSLENQRMIIEFVADLRRWIHRTSYFAWKSQLHERSTAIKETESELHSYFVEACESYSSVVSSPPLIDVIVIHFQEIGGKRESKEFNAFFVSHIQQHLLPEAAGWRSELLIDENADVKASYNDLHQSNITSTSIRESVKQQWKHQFNQEEQQKEEESNKENNFADCFTALGTIIFLSPRMCQISSMLSIPHRTYIPVNDDPCSYGGRLGNMFFSHKFNHATRSRKGFLLFSMRFGTTVVHFVNLHLFHDVNNAVALSNSPSIYALSRVHVVMETVAECLSVVSANEPIFFFGDFNTRLDGCSYANYLHREHGLVLHTQERELRGPETMWNLWNDEAFVHNIRNKFDAELNVMFNRVAMETGMELAEMPRLFGPTYLRVPHAVELIDSNLAVEKNKESVILKECNSYDTSNSRAAPLLSSRVRSLQHNRLPAWCDRVVFNVAGLELMLAGNTHSSWEATPQYTYHRDGHTQTLHDTIINTINSNKSGCNNNNTNNYNNKTSNVAQAHLYELPEIDLAMQDRTYLYDSVSFVHTDHDGVFMLF